MRRREHPAFPNALQNNVVHLTLTLHIYTGKKSLRSRDSTPSAAVLVPDRTSRTVKYASTCPSLCAATSAALLRLFPRRRYATLGLTQLNLSSKDQITRLVPTDQTIRRRAQGVRIKHSISSTSRLAPPFIYELNNLTLCLILANLRSLAIDSKEIAHG
jgi:hypothetical protein